MPIRNSAKAIIIENGRVLCNKNQNERGVYYNLPGGGQDYQENLREAVARECFEEAGVQIEVGELLLVGDYIARREQGDPRDPIHQVEFYFAGQLEEGETPRLGAGADNHQIGVEWVALDRLPGISFFPEKVKRYLVHGGPGKSSTYLGEL